MNPFEFDMALQRPVFYMMRRGIRIDRAKKLEFAQEAHDLWDQFQSSLNVVAGGFLNVNSPKQVHKYLYKELGVTERRKRDPKTGKSRVTADEDALRAIMANAEAAMAEAKRDDTKNRHFRIYLSTKLLLRIRGERKIISSYTGCPLECNCNKPSYIYVDDDSRMRCTISVGGTETMRFSHSKTLWDTGCNMATISHRLRQMFIADDGYELAELDLNRGESWVYTYLSMDPELLRIHTSGGDFHAETAAIIQGVFGSENLTADEIAALAKSGDKFGYKLRYLGKKRNHASAYRMGPFRAAEVVNEEADDTNITVTPTQMKEAGDLWLGKYFGIRGWWAEIDKQVEDYRYLTTSYGRKRDFYGFMNDSLKKEATAYEPQSTSVDYLNHGMLRVYDELVEPGHFGLELLHQNHDSILVQYPKQHRDNVIPEMISRIESVVNIRGHNVTIPVEATCGQNWGDYHKDKNPEGLRDWAA